MTIELTIDRIENNIAILKTDDSENIKWPTTKLPKNAKEGDVLNFTITDDQTAKSKKNNLAKDILNEILNTGNN